MTKSITDTGPPVHLSEISRLFLIKIFDTLIISTQVKKELEDFNAWHSLQQVESLSLQLKKVRNREIDQEKNR